MKGSDSGLVMSDEVFNQYRKRYIAQVMSKTLGIDVLLANTIHYLNTMPDVVTLYSCQGHTDSKTKKARSPYIAFGVGSQEGMDKVLQLYKNIADADMEATCYNSILLEHTVLKTDPFMEGLPDFIPALILRQVAKTDPAIHRFCRLVENAAFDVSIASHLNSKGA